MEYTDKKFWDEYFDKHKIRPTVTNSSLFSDIFEKYLTPDSTKSVFEIGCADSNFLCYLAKKFRYQSYGIDYSDAIAKTAELFQFNDLPKPVLYKEDLFKWQTDQRFDVVCSFGFIEHFDDINKVIAQHANLVAPNGKLIITLPHFAHGQYLIHWLIDRENLKKHNTKIMNLDSIKKAVQNNGLRIEHLSYYKTFGFWNERISMAWWERCINWSILKFGKLITGVFGYDRPNFIFSPHIVCVATKTSR